MPLPKRRHSKTRGKKRRTHWKLDPPALVECRQCHQKHRAHHVCPHCGYYAGKPVAMPEEV